MDVGDSEMDVEMQGKLHSHSWWNYTFQMNVLFPPPHQLPVQRLHVHPTWKVHGYCIHTFKIANLIMVFIADDESVLSSIATTISPSTSHGGAYPLNL